MTSFARVVKKIMDEKHLGVREIARASGLDASFFSKILSGKRNPPSEEKVIKRLSRALGVDYVYLMFLAGRIPSEFQEMFLSEKFILSLYNALDSVGKREKPAGQFFYHENKNAPRGSHLHREPLNKDITMPVGLSSPREEKATAHDGDKDAQDRINEDGISSSAHGSAGVSTDDEISEDLL